MGSFCSLVFVRDPQKKKKKNPFNYQIKFMEDQAKKGANHTSPFQNIEGIALYN